MRFRCEYIARTETALPFLITVQRVFSREQLRGTEENYRSNQHTPKIHVSIYIVNWGARRERFQLFFFFFSQLLPFFGVTVTRTITCVLLLRSCTGYIFYFSSTRPRSVKLELWRNYSNMMKATWHKLHSALT